MIVALLHAACVSAVQPNVLMIVSDDLRPALGAFHGDDTVFTPNLDALAADPRSTVFTRAYVQQAVCGPSRSSFLTGRRPDTTKLYDFGSYWRDVASNATTLPQHFKSSGYQTFSIGKIFHPIHTMAKAGHADDYPFSWTAPPYHPPTQKDKDAKVCPPLRYADQPEGQTYANLLCPVDLATMPGGTLPDIQSIDHALELLKNISLKGPSATTAAAPSPWLIGVGLHKPHIPLKFPKQYLDLYPLASIRQPAVVDVPAGLPPVAYDTFTDVRSRMDTTAVVNRANVTFPYGLFPMNFTLQIRQHYFAAVSYIDAEAGRLLDYVNKTASIMDQTIVVLFGDHGWQLGDRGEWAKYSTCDTATRTPLIIRTAVGSSTALGRRTATQGGIRFSSALVELVDLFATLADLAGLAVPPICPELPSSMNVSVGLPSFCTEGTSFKAALDQAAIWPGKPAAFSQYPRPSDAPGDDSDLPDCDTITRMGYTMKTATFRFTEWVSFACMQPKDGGPIESSADWSQVHAVELYNSSADSGEAHNLAQDPSHKDLVTTLSKQLRCGWRGALWPNAKCPSLPPSLPMPPPPPPSLPPVV